MKCEDCEEENAVENMAFCKKCDMYICLDCKERHAGCALIRYYVLVFEWQIKDAQRLAGFQGYSQHTSYWNNTDHNIFVCRYDALNRINLYDLLTSLPSFDAIKNYVAFLEQGCLRKYL